MPENKNYQKFHVRNITKNLITILVLLKGELMLLQNESKNMSKYSILMNKNEIGRYNDLTH